MAALMKYPNSTHLGLTYLNMIPTNLIQNTHQPILPISDKKEFLFALKPMNAMIQFHFKLTSSSSLNCIRQTLLPLTSSKRYYNPLCRRQLLTRL